MDFVRNIEDMKKISSHFDGDFECFDEDDYLNKLTNMLEEADYTDYEDYQSISRAVRVFTSFFLIVSNKNYEENDNFNTENLIELTKYYTKILALYILSEQYELNVEYQMDELLELYDINYRH